MIKAIEFDRYIDYIYHPSALEIVKEVSEYGIYVHLLIFSIVTIINLRIVLHLSLLNKLSVEQIFDKYGDFRIRAYLVSFLIPSFFLSLYCIGQFLRALLAPHLYTLEQVMANF